ncbi:MAG TPA: vWA domain-containing protein [Gemmatimonadales bacterium]|nr:vWA domain-containing protein [Gemmatimonadales bacterium]
MPYSAEISRANPSCFVFVIDQSASMLDVLDPINIQQLDKPLVIDGRSYTHTAQGRTKAQAVADAINRLLQDLVIKCAKSEGVRDYYYVAVIGYGGNVGPAFSGALAGRDLVPISEIATSPARIEERNKKVDDGAGGLVEQKIKFPIWFDAVGNNGTPMCSALIQAHGILSRWLTDHPDCFPPVVIHITDGESTDGDPAPAMAQLKSLASSDGNVMLFNLHLSGNPNAVPVTFPNSPAQLPDQYARTLFEGSSVLTPFMCAVAREQGINVSEGARGFVLNGDIAMIIQALEIGTRPSNLR